MCVHSFDYEFVYLSVVVFNFTFFIQQQRMSKYRTRRILWCRLQLFDFASAYYFKWLSNFALFIFTERFGFFGIRLLLVLRVPLNVRILIDKENLLV